MEMFLFEGVGRIEETQIRRYTMNRKLICDILNHEMMLATGCTEPAAIALTAAVARRHLQGEISRLELKASVNIIKNAMSAGIPGTDRTGMQYAAALGAVAGRVDRQLQVVDDATAEEVAKALELVDSGKVVYGRCESPEKLYIEVALTSETGHTSRAITAGSHTNLCYLEEDGTVLMDESAAPAEVRISPELISETLSIQAIYDFVETLDRAQDDLYMIEQAIKVNGHIAEVGAKGNYGLNIGRNIRKNQAKGWMSRTLVDDAVAETASGADARMAGANVPVVTNSGSGNQGITATVPILSAARSLNIDEERTFRAVTLSHLMAIHIHADFGLLSGLCGATIAGAGAACGITYLLGGTVEQIGKTINNIFGDVTGMLCDGAKADCALKISTCVYTAFQCAFMALRDIEVQDSDGIVEKDPEKTIQNFVALGNYGSPKMDDLVLDILLKKTAV